MPPAVPSVQISADNSDQKTLPENPISKETESIETVADAWKNVCRDVQSNHTDSDISASATVDDKSENFLTDNISNKTASSGVNGAGGAESGDSEVVVNNKAASSVLKPSPSVGMSLQNLLDANIGASGKNGGAENGSSTSMMEEAWKQLKMSFVNFKGQRVGTLAAIDTGGETLNYNQV